MAAAVDSWSANAIAASDTDTLSAAGLLAVWGLAYGAVPVTLQTWIMRAAPDTTESASSLYVSTFNLSIALGALFGGWVVDLLSPSGVLWIGAALALLTIVVVRRGSGRGA